MRPTSLHTRLVAGVVAVAATAVVLAGCSSTHSAQIAHAATTAEATQRSPSASASASLTAEQKFQVSVRAFTRCANAHGLSVQYTSTGTPYFDKFAKGGLAAVNACYSFLLHNPRDPKISWPPLSAGAFAKEKQFSRCMRSHGVTAYPDPVRSTNPDDPDYKHESSLENAIDHTTQTFKHAYSTCESTVDNVHGGVG